MKAIGENKRCCSCKEWKHIGKFVRSKNRSDGLGSECRECCSKRTREYREKNKEMINRRRKEYREKNKERLRARGREWYKKNKDISCAYALAKNEKFHWMKDKLAEFGINV